MTGTQERETKMKTEIVNVYNMATFEDKIARLNKKAVKLNLTPIEYRIMGDLTKSVENSFLERITYVIGKEIEITFEDEIKIDGNWNLVAALDHKENLIKVVPNMVLPELYRERGNICDHCNISRIRNDTFVLVNGNGEYKQIGRNCLAEFLGIDPQRFLSQWEMDENLNDTIDEDNKSARATLAVDLQSFLTVTNAVIRAFGWISSSSAYAEVGKVATVSHVREAIFFDDLKNAFGKKMDLTVLEEDREIGKTVFEWMKQLGDRKGLNDYLFNLASIGENGFVSSKSSGFAASAIIAYRKETEEVSSANGNANGNVLTYVGKVGDKISLCVKYIKSVDFDSQYGWQSIHTFKTIEGNIVCWKTSSSASDLGINIGNDYRMTATVKSLDSWKGIPQTHVIRAKLK